MKSEKTDLPDAYAPLTLARFPVHPPPASVDGCDVRGTWLGRLYKWFTTPSTFKQIDGILARRRAFPADKWDAVNIPADNHVRRILCVIKDEGWWCNDHFVPDDMVVVLVVHSANDLMGLEAAMELREQFGFDLEPLEQAIADGMTVQQFLRHFQAWESRHD